jgi:hypothetical protein
LEFWPDYAGAILWEAGQPVSLDVLPIPPSLRDEARAWVQEYDDSKLPWQATRDEAWIRRGSEILKALQEALEPQGITVEPNEDYW